MWISYPHRRLACPPAGALAPRVGGARTREHPSHALRHPLTPSGSPWAAPTVNVFSRVSSRAPGGTLW